MFAKLTHALFGVATEGQRKAGQGFYFGGILAVALFGSLAAVAFNTNPAALGPLTQISLAVVTAIKVLFGILIGGFGLEYMGKAAKVIGGRKESGE